MTNASEHTEQDTLRGAANESDAPSDGTQARPVLLLRHVDDKSGAPPRRIALAKFCATIGREGHCDIQLSESSGVSRVHAQVFVIDGEVVVEDLGSRNGTFVNAKVLRGNRQTTLKHGDVITIGKYRLKLANRPGQVRSGARDELTRLMSAWNAAAVPSLVVRRELSEYGDVDTLVLDGARIEAPDSADAVELGDTHTCKTLMPAQEPATVTAPTRQPPQVHGVRFERDLPRRARQAVKRGASRRTMPILQAAVARRRLQVVRRGL